MFVTIWKYKINPTLREQFIDHYKEDGKWVELFKKHKGFIKTEFYQGESQDEFITIDKWDSRENYSVIKSDVDYKTLDKKCENFTEEEFFLGNYSSE